jgi:hypothetical protein
VDGTLQLNVEPEEVFTNPLGHVVATVTLNRPQHKIIDLTCSLQFNDDLDPEPRYFTGWNKLFWYDYLLSVYLRLVDLK